MSPTPLLSIGIIFKNEARCIERCLKSLEPLRQAVPCEIIMADTGAEDGSREIAEQYADEVFDFEWINDFAAARNAVMDRCKGKWYMSIDCDEWLHEDISELTAFLRGRKKADFVFLTVRNYFSEEREKSEVYTDFYGLRLVRMSTGERYHGAIHETWYYTESVDWLSHTIFHHDGYYYPDPQEKKKKEQRNMKLLHQKLKEDPEDLRTLTQCIESGGTDPDIMQYVRTAVALVQKKSNMWKRYGPAIFSYAVIMARAREMPEMEEWIEFAHTQFPDSIVVRVDMNHTAFMAAHDAEEWEKAIYYGEEYRKGMRAYRSDHRSPKIENELIVSSLQFASAIHERTLLIGLVNAYYQAGQADRALRRLTELDGEKLSAAQVKNMVVLLSQLHAQTRQKVAPALIDFYEQISREGENRENRTERLAAFDTIAAAAFTRDYQETEQDYRGHWRPAYTAFRVLADKCEAGRGAEIMMAFEPEEMRATLARVEDWAALPIEALEHAIQAGVAFPLEERPLNIEVLDGLASELAPGKSLEQLTALSFADGQECPDIQGLYWAQSLILASLRALDWKAASRKSEEALALIRRFAQIEGMLLPQMYAPQALTHERAALLPPMHRWGLYCLQALEALDAGRPQEYLTLLRKGLKACPGEKDMVQFLLDRFIEDTRPKASPELLALAEKVRTILSAFDPNDPAVTAIRESPAYQQVAWLIEPEPVGRMVQ